MRSAPRRFYRDHLPVNGELYNVEFAAFEAVKAAKKLDVRLRFGHAGLANIETEDVPWSSAISP
jgi:hypothetical protein